MTRTMMMLAAVLATAIAAPTLATAQAATNRPVEFMAGGIPVIFKPITANDVVAVRLYLRGGSAAQTAATAGIERLMTGLVTEGTQKYTKDQFAALATETGTRFGSEMAYDYSVVSMQAVRQNWTQAWDLFTEAVLRPTFPEEEVTRAKGQLLNALRQQRDNPDQLLTLLADSVAYVGSPFAVNPAGTVAGVEGLTRAQLQQWHRTRLTKSNVVLVVVGNVTRPDLEARVASAFGSLPATGGEPRPATPPPGGKAEVLTVQQALPTNYIAGMFRVPSPNSPDYPAARLGLYLLSTRLFEEVRTKRNLSYAVASSMFARSANLGRLYVTAVDPDTTLKVMLTEVRRLQQEPVTAKQLHENSNVFATSYFSAQQTNMGQATQLGMFELIGGGWENEGSFIERLRSVTPQQIQRVAEQYLRDARFVVIGDPGKVDRALYSSW